MREMKLEIIIAASAQVAEWCQKSYLAALRRGCDGDDDAYARRKADKAAAERLSSAAALIHEARRGGSVDKELAALLADGQIESEAAAWVAFFKGTGPRPGSGGGSV